MVDVQNSDFTKEENAVLDDVADIVREDRRKRFKFNGQLSRSKGTLAFHEMNVRQLRRIARDPEYILLKEIYLRLSELSAKILKQKY